MYEAGEFCAVRIAMLLAVLNVAGTGRNEHVASRLMRGDGSGGCDNIRRRQPSLGRINSAEPGDDLS